MAQFKKVIGSTGKAHYRLTMGAKETASLVALLDNAKFGGHYLSRIVTAIDSSEDIYELPSAGVTLPTYGVIADGTIEVE